MERIDKVIVKAVIYFCAILMLAMAVIVTAQVVSRYVVGRPFTWSEELARYIFVWMTFLGMAVGVKQGSHVALDILVKKLKGVSQKTLMIINNALLLVFSISLSVSGIKLVQLGMLQKSPTLQIPMQFVYIVIPISGILMTYFILGHMIRILTGKASIEKEELA